MVIINGENIKVDTSSIITYSRQRRGKRLSQKFIPREMWFEILSRLPIKSLFISRRVCKLWRKWFFDLEYNIDSNPLSVPVCGLFLLSFNPVGDRGINDSCVSYFCLGTKKNFVIQCGSPENNLIYSSGNGNRLLWDISFDFSVLLKLYPHGPKNQFDCFVMHKGLIYSTHNDGTYEVQNPATKDIHFVPKSAIVKEYGFIMHYPEERRGVIIQFRSFLHFKSLFIVVRFCVRMRLMEVYHNKTCEWVQYSLKLDDEFLFRLSCRFGTWAGFFEREVLSLYLLTTKDRGIAIKFWGPMNPEMRQYSFPLPQVVLAEMSATRIWECENSLYLSYHNATGLWIWKPGCTQVDAWTWIPMLEINPARQLCKPFAREHLSKLVLSASVQVMPLAFHPDVAVVYLWVKSSVFVYNLNEDTLDLIGEIKDHEHWSLDLIFSFRPSLSLMDSVIKPSSI